MEWAFLAIRRLAVTYFRGVYPPLSSARRRFTALFGMGRGGANALWPPGNSVGPRIIPEGATGRLGARAGGRSHFGRMYPDSHPAWRWGVIHPSRLTQGYRIKPHGPLVWVSSTHYCASTSHLSTRWSSATLQVAYATGGLILRQVSRLDAFSGYLSRT